MLKTDGRRFGRIRAAIALGIGLALIPAAMFAASSAGPLDGIASVVAQGTATATPKATTTATAAPKATATTAPAAPKSGTGGFLADQGGNQTLTIVLLVAAAGSAAVAGRMVARRR